MVPQTMTAAMLVALVTLAAPASAGYWVSVGGTEAYIEVEPGEQGPSGEVRTNRTDYVHVTYASSCTPTTGECAANAAARAPLQYIPAHFDCALRVENMPGRCEVGSGTTLLASGNGSGDGRNGEGCLHLIVFFNFGPVCGKGYVEAEGEDACASMVGVTTACATPPRVGTDGFSPACASVVVGRTLTDLVCVQGPHVREDGSIESCASWLEVSAAACVTIGACGRVFTKHYSSENRRELYCVGGLP